jgi:hypothetical protein
MSIARFLAPVLAATFLLLPTGPAMAGGAWLETRRDHYAVGERAVARGTFGRGYLDGTVADGPFTAYLVPQDRILPKGANVPSWAIPLGPMEISDGAGRICCWIARLAFTVPDVQPGYYSIEYCDVPCTVNGIGDLSGGGFWLGRTRDEARLLGEAAALQLDNESLARQVRRAENRADRISDERSELENDVLTLRNKVTSLEREIGPLPAAPTSRERTPWPAWAWAISAIAGLAVGALIGSRRSQRVRSRRAPSSDRWSAPSGAVNPPGETDEAVHPSSPEPHPSAPSRTKARPEGRRVESVR